jgi:hypothetical protein
MKVLFLVASQASVAAAGVGICIVVIFAFLIQRPADTTAMNRSTKMFLLFPWSDSGSQRPHQTAVDAPPPRGNN